MYKISTPQTGFPQNEEGKPMEIGQVNDVTYMTG